MFSREPSGPTEVDLQAQVAHLEQALTRSKVLGLAVGILMERHKIAANDAFGMLCEASNISNRKLGDVAADLCDTGLLPQSVRRETPDDSGGDSAHSHGTASARSRV